MMLSDQCPECLMYRYEARGLWWCCPDCMEWGTSSPKDAKPAEEVNPVEEQRARYSEQCRTCLQPTRWFDRGTRGYRVGPFEESGVVYIQAGRGIAQTMGYRLHECSGERPLVPETEEVVLTADEARQVAQEESLLRYCPKCKAAPEHPCTNQSRGKSAGMPTAWPHAERWS